MGRALLADQDSGSGSLLENTGLALGKLSPDFLAPRTWFHGGQFFQARGGGAGDGFQITFSVHLISIIIIITSAPTSEHQVSDLRLSTLALFSALPDKFAGEIKTEETEKGDLAKSCENTHFTSK